MEILILIITVFTIIYFLAKGKGKKSKEYEITINSKSFRSLDNDYEDIWDSYEEPQKDKIFEAEYPLFYALRNKRELFDYISSELHDLAKILSSQNSENIKSAVYQMLPQNNYKRIKGLPQYLQVVPIKSLLSNGIFVNPTESDLSQLLNSMTMDILKSYCGELDIKPARSKKETIERLLESSVKEKIDFNQYFILNPKVKEINHQFGNYCQLLNEKQLNQRKIRFKNIVSRLDPEELNDKQEKGIYSIQEYGYSSVIYFKKGSPLFRIMGVTLNKWNDCALLLNNGRILVSENSRIDNWTTMRISIVDENKKILAQYKIKDMSNYDISEFEDKPLVFLNLLDNSYWILNYETLEEKCVENPENLDVYSLAEDL